MLAESLSALLAGLAHWRDRKNDDVAERRRKQEAVGYVMDAVVLTKGYLYDLEQGSPSSRDREHEVSRAWQRAANFIREYDYQLYNSAQLKAMGWSDPREWRKVEERPWAVKLDNISAQCRWLQDND